jgi:hypothetical protein
LLNITLLDGLKEVLDKGLHLGIELAWGALTGERVLLRACHLIITHRVLLMLLLLLLGAWRRKVLLGIVVARRHYTLGDYSGFILHDVHVDVRTRFYSVRETFLERGGWLLIRGGRDLLLRMRLLDARHHAQLGRDLLTGHTLTLVGLGFNLLLSLVLDVLVLLLVELLLLDHVVLSLHVILRGNPIWILSMMGQLLRVLKRLRTASIALDDVSRLHLVELVL